MAKDLNLEDFVYSFRPTNAIPTTLNGMFYFDVKLAFILGGAYLRTLYIMARTGETFVNAGYTATNSYKMLKFMKQVQTGSRFVQTGSRFIARTPGVLARNPVLLAPVGAVVFAQEVIRDPAFQKTGTPKFGIPLPLWLLIVGARGGGDTHAQRSPYWLTTGGHFHVEYSFNPHWIS